MITRLARWWLNRHTPKAEPAQEVIGWCCAPRCGVEVTGDARHVVVAVALNDEALGVAGGATGMAAEFCAEHCPGGCRQGCVAG